MIDEIALTERFLEVLACLALEAVRILNWSLYTGAGALVNTTLAGLISRVLVTEHQVMSVELTSLRRFH